MADEQIKTIVQKGMKNAIERAIKNPPEEGGFRLPVKAEALDYFSASNTRSRISSTVPRPEMRRYCGAFNDVVASPFFAQPL